MIQLRLGFFISILFALPLVVVGEARLETTMSSLSSKQKAGNGNAVTSIHLRSGWTQKVNSREGFATGNTNYQRSKDSTSLPWLTQQVTSEIVIVSPADDIWRIVTDWRRLSELVPSNVESTEVAGFGANASWVIFLLNGAIIEEKMIAFDSHSWTMQYTMTSTPMPVKHYVGTIQLLPVSRDQIKVTITGDFWVEDVNRLQVLETFKAFQDEYLSSLHTLISG